jgi:hypothetical protein
LAEETMRVTGLHWGTAKFLNESEKGLQLQIEFASFVLTQLAFLLIESVDICIANLFGENIRWLSLSD